MSDEHPADMLARLGSDGLLWAQEFNKIAVRLGYSEMDEGWLIGWFANAIENSCNPLRNECDRLRAELAAEREAYFRLSAQTIDLRAERDALRAELAAERKNNKSFNKHLTRARGNTQTMKAERDTLRAERDAERQENEWHQVSKKEQANVINSLMAERDALRAELAAERERVQLWAIAAGKFEYERNACIKEVAETGKRQGQAEAERDELREVLRKACDVVYDGWPELLARALKKVDNS